MGELGSIPGLGISPGGWHGNPFQYSCLENPQGQKSLLDCSPWGCKESDTTERLSTAQQECTEIHLLLLSGKPAFQDHINTGEIFNILHYFQNQELHKLTIPLNNALKLTVYNPIFLLTIKK